MEIEFTSKDYFHYSTTTAPKKIKNLISSPFCLALFSRIPLLKFKFLILVIRSSMIWSLLSLPTPSFSLASQAPAQWFAKCDPGTTTSPLPVNM